MDNLSEQQYEEDAQNLDNDYMESDPEDQQEDYIASEEDGQLEASENEAQDYQARVADLERQLDDEKRKFEDSFRNQQSNYDRRIAEMENQIRDFMSSQDSQQESFSDDQYKDEYGDYRNLTPNEISDIVQQNIQSYLDKENKKQSQTKQEQQRIQAENQRWVASQRNNKEVMEYYNSNQQRLDREFVNRGISPNDTRQMYLVAESDMYRNKTKKRKPNVPPVGSNGRTHANRSNTNQKGSELMQALGRMREQTRGGRR